MRVWLKAFAIFAVLAVAPFIIGRNPLFSSGRHGGSKPCCAKPLAGDFPWDSVLNWGGLALLVLLVLAAIAFFAYYISQAYEVSELLTLAEREMTSQLRAWGGALQADTRKGWVKERGEWLSHIKDFLTKEDSSDLAKKFYDTSSTDLGGGAQGAAMGKVRITAFLLREVYEGNVENAQLKIHHEVLNGSKPFIAPGLRQILEYDKFDEKKGFPPGSGVNWVTLEVAIKIFRHPRHIVMVQNNAEIWNWDVLNLLNRQAPPSPPKT